MKLLLLLTFLFFSYLLPAQQFGFKAGAFYNTMNFRAAGMGNNVKSSWKPGFYIGGLLRVPLNDVFALQPEYLYKPMRGEDKIIHADYTLHYLSLPVLLQIAVSKQISVLAGPEFGLLIHARQGTLDATHDTEERALSAVGGLEVKVASRVFVEARYVHGLNHVGLGQRSALREFKWRGVELGGGVRF